MLLITVVCFIHVLSHTIHAMSLHTMSATPIDTGDAYVKHLRGNIGTKLGVQMQLVMSAGKLRGTYFYERFAPFYVGAVNDRRLNLEGTIDRDGRFILTEALNGKVTGIFRGRSEGIAADGAPVDVQAVRLTGAWSRSNGTNSMPFTLTEIGFELKDAARFVAQRRVENDVLEGVAYHLSIARPLLKNDAQAARANAFNRAITKLIGEMSDEFRNEVKEYVSDETRKNIAKNKLPPKSLDIDYQILFTDANFVSLRFTKDAFFGAYPYTTFVSLNYDLRTQRAVAFKALFKSEADYITELDRICAELFKHTPYAEFPAEARLSVTNTSFTGWNATPDYLVLNFSVPHVLGDTVEVFVPYDELKGIINPTGLLAGIMD
ncbi:MAG: hypothetical protein MSG64_07620 [Pyrinomonadaceae bacterium MAG19_C2-C3]|nr:hypothetical protein [Pyrinomonadaceae bacterium MAG19_C2-C3]